MEIGLYESLLTSALSTSLDQLDGLVASTAKVDEADAPHVLARHVAAAVEQRLRSIKDEERRVEIVNALIDQLTEHSGDVVSPPSQLLSISQLPGPGARVLSSRPATPLTEAALLTNASGE